MLELSFYLLEMDNSTLILVIMISTLIFGIVLNYNASENRFGTNLTVIGILGIVGVRLYNGNF